MSSKNFYITSPIYYVNDVPHIGHAYTSLACDVLARSKRLSGYNVHFLTGTDEHGQKVEKSALLREKTPQQFCDEISLKFRELADFMGYSHDDFIRTTEERHKKVAQVFWQKLQENGWIYKDVYEGWYALRDEAFYNEDELIDGKSPTGAEVAWHKEESYFFKLSSFQNNLLALYEAVPDFIQPESKRNEVISFVKSGLKDLSISRTSFKWGVPVPGDEKHIMYVWLDALTNYISALNFSSEDDVLYKNFWENTVESPIHVVGKDILRFHCVYWPAFLMAAKLPLPNRIFAHGWWTNSGQKISKSLGNVIDPCKEIEWLESFKYKEKQAEIEVEKNIPQKIAVDYFRYFLLKEVPFGSDGDYSRENFINRINAELANNIGNLAQRSLTMIIKNCNSEVPQFSSKPEQNQEIYNSIKQDINDLSFNQALEKIIELSSLANKYFNDQAPWNLKKENKIEEMNDTLYKTVENIRVIAILFLPFIPNSAGKILDILNIDEEDRNFSSLDKAIKAGHKINPPQIIFPGIRIN
ncbi:MAG: methionyl-tRNA ligase [Rickettsiaceae bacterium]|jgi:methionyl-tRNA synthetase|nr:methionyl-tRNA ligase [Rickettsiaceae bacterium]